MVKLLLKFAIPLKRYELGSHAHAGPVFHRWLPDGRKDSIVLVDEQLSATLELWFERRGYVYQGVIEFDHHRCEFDSGIMARQAVLDAGPLRGLLAIGGVTGETLVPVQSGEVGHELYVALGKRIVKNVLEPQLSRFLDILRANYGQYWIGGRVNWDSRQMSLGQYCNLLNLQWSLDEGATWDKFIPDEPKNEPITLVLSPDQFSGLMTEGDWSEFRDAFVGGFDPSLAGGVLSRSHELLDQGAVKYALIEAVTALELAMSEFTRIKLPSEERLRPWVDRISDLPLPAKAVWILSLLGEIGSEELETAVEAVVLRNKVVHEGGQPPDGSADKIQNLQQTISRLLAGPAFRFPPMTSKNKIYPTEGQ